MGLEQALDVIELGLCTERKLALPAIRSHCALARARARRAHDEIIPAARAAHADTLAAYEIQVNSALELVFGALFRAQIDLHPHRLVFGQVRTRELDDVLPVDDGPNQAQKLV